MNNLLTIIIWNFALLPILKIPLNILEPISTFCFCWGSLCGNRQNQQHRPESKTRKQWPPAVIQFPQWTEFGTAHPFSTQIWSVKKDPLFSKIVQQIHYPGMDILTWTHESLCFTFLLCNRDGGFAETRWPKRARAAHQCPNLAPA